MSVAKAILLFLARLLVAAIIFATPLAVAGFIEWNTSIASWSRWSRAGVGLAWVLLIAGLLALFFGDGKDAANQG